MNPRLNGAIVAACLAMLPMLTNAAPVVNIQVNNATLVPDDNVKPLDFFSSLAGVKVTFKTLTDAFTKNWAAGDGSWGAGDFCGGVAVDGFSLGGCGDTFINLWYLDNNTHLTNPDSLMGFEVDFRGTGHFFDRTEPNPGSFDSSAGLDFTFFDSTVFDLGGIINVRYSVPGMQAPEDLYKVLTVDLQGLTGGSGLGALDHGASLRFRQDTDDTDVVPLPAAGWLLVTGGIALASLRRRRRV